MKMLKIVIKSFLFSYFNVSLVQSLGCPGGIAACQSFTWANWGICNSTCNGVKTRYKPLCCIQPNGQQRSFDDCLKVCNITKDVYFKVNVDTAKCGNFCDGHCVHNPCSHGTCVNTTDGFHCNCYHIYEGKTCTKMKAWAIGTITAAVLAGSAMLCVCFWCLWRYVMGYDDKEKQDNPRISQVEPMT